MLSKGSENGVMWAKWGRMGSYGARCGKPLNHFLYTRVSMLAIPRTAKAPPPVFNFHLGFYGGFTLFV